jgi:hypothetical protein
MCFPLYVCHGSEHYSLGQIEITQICSEKLMFEAMNSVLRITSFGKALVQRYLHSPSTPWGFCDLIAFRFIIHLPISWKAEGVPRFNLMLPLAEI